MKSLENITRSQIENMDYHSIETLMEKVMREAQAERYREALLNIIDETEARIVTPKLVH